MTGATGRPVVASGGSLGAPSRTATPALGGAMTAERIAAVLAERDAIQANLLDLDNSFVRQLLDGARLTGQTGQRWAACTATLTGLWETYLAYSAVVDRIAQLSGGARGPAKKDQAELTELLAAPCVQLPAAQVPLGRRDLTAAGNPPVTIATAVQTMRGSFAEVTMVTGAVEAVLSGVGPPLDAAAADLLRVRPLAAGLGGGIEAELAAAQSDLDALRATMATDPLSLLNDPMLQTAMGATAVGVDTSSADRLRARAAALAVRVADLDRLRAGARNRIDALAASVLAARAARQEAIAAWHQAKTRVTQVPALPPAIAEPPLASLAATADGGRWDRLGAELDRCEAELAAAAGQTRDLTQAAAAAVARRDELRGLLGAYKAKAARLGGAESVALAEHYDQAHELLWTAPCDLAAAQAAVTAYQRAILATEGRR
jgi:hypothetical protein